MFSIMHTFVMDREKCLKIFVRFTSFLWKASIFDLMSNQNIITKSKDFASSEEE